MEPRATLPSIQIVVITGPIASGKTTVAKALAIRFREYGLVALDADLDDTVKFLSGGDWSQVRVEHWERAREMTGSVINQAAAIGLDLVFLAGPFFTATERAHLLSCISNPRDVSFVLLKVSLDESIRRTCLQTERAPLIRDPDFITKIYETIDWETVPANDFEIDTDGRTIENVVATIFEWALDRR